MKTTYTSINLRYLHDVVTGEFANVGVVVYAPEMRFLGARFTTSYERLNAIFLKVDHLHFRALMRHLDNRFDELAAEIRDGLILPSSLLELVRQVLPPDDGSLQWSQPAGGFTADPSKTMEELFKRYVERYIAGAEQVSRTDEEIAKPFKARLGQAAKRLVSKRIESDDYQYEFRFAWQNDVWHLYEPVSFDLVDPNSIREKAVRWYGRGAALKDSPEPFKIYFLLGEPRQPGTQTAFAHALHLLAKIPGEKQIVREQEIPEVAEQVAAVVAGPTPAEMVLKDKPRHP